LGNLDKMIRFSLAVYPPQLSVSIFYPALSTYQVAQPFNLEEFRVALAHYFHANPFFATCQLQEHVFESPDSFTVNHFQSVLTENYPNYFSNFLVMSVRYASNPKLQGIFTVFPIPLMDGFKCFLFHQALMKTLKSRKDEFRIQQSIAEHNLKLDDLAQYLPAPNGTISPEERCERLPFEIVETVDPVLKVIPFLEKVQKDFVAKECKLLVYLKNSSPTTLLFGSFLTFLKSPEEVVINSTGAQLKHCHDQQFTNFQKKLDGLHDPEQIVALGREFFPQMQSAPAPYFINNYGNCSAFRNNDFDPERGNLVRYQWHMPVGVLKLMKGVIWTITIGDKAFTFTR